MTDIPPSIGSVAAGPAPADTSRLASKDNLDKAGQRFEAIFTGMMLRSMRAAKFGEGLFDNQATQQFRDMFDDRIAENMAVSTPLGIGKAMTDFLAKSQPVAAAPAADTAGDTP